MNFAERLKKLRKINGYTQVLLADKLGVSKGTVAMWETGKRTPDYEIINVMSNMFDRRIDYILGYSDDDSSLKMSSEKFDQLCKWEVQTDEINIFRQYLRLDSYGRMCVDALINREIIRCKDQGTEQDISDITVGIRSNKTDQI